MRIAGTAQLTAPPEKVYDALQDGEVLAATIPGVQSLHQVNENHYKLSIVAGVASIKGVYDGEVELSEQNRPSSFVMTASGAGAPGTVKAEVTVSLEPSATGTTLTYDADAVVGGMVGGVGQRMITGVAKKMANTFFTSIDEVIAHGLPTQQATAGIREPAADASGVVDLGSEPSGEVAEGQLRQVANPVAASADSRKLLAAALVGAAIALAGVATGAVVRR